MTKKTRRPKTRPSMTLPAFAEVDLPEVSVALPEAVGVDLGADDDDEAIDVDATASPVEQAETALGAIETAFKARAKTEQERLTLSTDSRYWIAVCFETEAQKTAFLTRLKLGDLGNLHLDGIEVAKRLGVPFKESERVKWPKARSFGSLAKLADEG